MTVAPALVVLCLGPSRRGFQWQKHP
jgi:hypothetical protein